MAEFFLFLERNYLLFLEGSPRAEKDEKFAQNVCLRKTATSRDIGEEAETKGDEETRKKPVGNDEKKTPAHSFVTPCTAGQV